MSQICERCKWAWGCTLHVKRLVYSGRTGKLVCVDRKGRHRGEPELLPPEEASNPQTEWEELSVYGTVFDPFEDQRNERYGEERLEYPQSRVKRWMDTAEARYNNMVIAGRSVGSKPATEFERACKVLAHLKKGKVNINDLSRPMDEIDQRLRDYELARFYKNERVEPRFREDVERFLQDLFLENLGVFPK